MKTKILQLIGSFHSGGSERQAVQLVRLLKEEKNCEVFIACLNKKGVLLKEIEQLGFTNFPEFPLTSFYDANFLRQLRNFAEYLRENKIDVIQTSDFYTNVFGMFAGRLAKTPVRIAAKRETGTKTGAQSFIERRAFSFADAIVVNAGAVKKHLIESGIKAEKIKVIYNGLNLERLNATQNQATILREFNLPDEPDLRFVTIIANFRSDVKNQKMFLRAARKTTEKIPNARFILAGEGELLDEAKTYAAELGIADETSFTGACANVAALLAVSDVCVLSSRTEGFSNSILEYMAAGKPVIATNVGGASEAIIENETGFLVASDDDETMARRLIELLSDAEKAVKMGTRGRHIVEEKFSTAAQIEKNLALYEKLLSEKQKIARNSFSAESEELVK